MFSQGVGVLVFWEDRGVGSLLRKIKDILSNTQRATKYSILGVKQGRNRESQLNKKIKNPLLEISLHCTGISPKNAALNLRDRHR